MAFDECVVDMPSEDLNRQQAKQYTCIFDVYILKKAFTSEFFFAGFLFKKIWQTWRLTSPNLSLLRPSIAEI